ncbi:lipase [Rhodococcus sp. IEGM 1401]|uniref:lipase family protein n=1 Tax=unclassified Rhodococcus (in: high G+C Gram-positive bacteria) TaxID=192944 RepID=UPI0022B592AD|nr:MULTISPECIES: lipase family protein [unclassified Rhodococcus (in: high G+C Gram-positive bacteria)]MCZ4561083.1 lipase [Rhodococcus sp. IEGM 1401]MDI9921282.1 lipase family protein [Rhodococcus sp. IEGM 1372]MDV8033735.1 lipase family protein [Rhodococcus sp. IEGM 1414]
MNHRLFGWGTVLVVSVLLAPVAHADSGVGPRIVAESVVIDAPVAHPGASVTTVFRYTSVGVDGGPTEMTGSYSLPRTPPPPGGWPILVFSHMTVGGADKCAPSTIRAGDPEVVRTNTGDAVAGRMLDAGFVVVRPDYEGIGTPGPHPYLMGASLARAVIDSARAVHGADNRIGSDVVLMGHSEGAVASLFASAAELSEWGPLRLRGVTAVTPPTGMRQIIEGATAIPLSGAGIGDLVSLAALFIVGAGAVDPAFSDILRDGGLSADATALLPDVENRCFGELSSPTSFGRLAPSQLLGPKGKPASAALAKIADANDVFNLNIDPAIPIRIDAGAADPVVPVPVALALATQYRSDGNDVTFAVQPGGHTAVPSSPEAAESIANWLVGVAG